MLIVIANLIVKSGKTDELLEITKNLIKETRLEKGNLGYNLYSSTEDSNAFTFLEQWESEDALNEHMETSHFKQFVEDAEDILAEDIEINSYSIS